MIFLTTLEQWFWHMWDNLWRLLLWNLALFALSIPLLIARSAFDMIIALGWFVLVWGPAVTGTISWCWQMADEKSPDARDLLRRLGGCYPRALGLHLIFALLAGVIGFGLHFYSGPNGQEIFGPLVSMGFAGFALWFGLLAIGWWMWCQVAIAEDRAEGPRRFGNALVQGGKILLVHPLLTLLHIAIIGMALVISVQVRFPLVLFTFTWVTLYLATAVYEMYVASEVKVELAAKAEAKEEHRPTSWKEIMAEDEKPNAAMTYRGRRPRRSLRELFKPWEQ